MSGYVNLVEIGWFLFIGLLFMGLNLLLMSRRLIRTRYGMLSILGASVWPALMIVLSVQGGRVLDGLTEQAVTLESVLSWAVVVATVLMVCIPAVSLIRRMVGLARN
ncbi:hypothetical protein EVJ33_09425 [Exiguobacterium sp. SL-10]|uniref:hypothetical protein n=1 Tax=unclassified Exiguobacterium TaxID=2644629 RepID=UPI00103B671A|nr:MULTISPECIES: hypothetical protein [unclassified Exiguobacterium]TCI22007.1 hypothetical protein EVJ34_05115 [Exiguobacterium sp. SL-9]TCI29485.1 hypothetical protein EVJ33_09425 [Exiguobacterium sp. SL-10]